MASSIVYPKCIVRFILTYITPPNLHLGTQNTYVRSHDIQKETASMTELTLTSHSTGKKKNQVW